MFPWKLNILVNTKMLEGIYICYQHQIQVFTPHLYLTWVKHCTDVLV